MDWLFASGHPRYTGARKGRPWVAHTRRLPTDDKNDTDKRQDKRAFSETGVDCAGQVMHLESYMVAGSEVAHPDHQSLIAWHCSISINFLVLHIADRLWSWSFWTAHGRHPSASEATTFPPVEYFDRALSSPDGSTRFPQHLFSAHDHGRLRSNFVAEPRFTWSIRRPDCALSRLHTGVRPAGDPVDGDPSQDFLGPHPRSSRSSPRKALDT